MRSTISFLDSDGTLLPSWEYSRDTPLQNIFPTPSFRRPFDEEEIHIKPTTPGRGRYRETQYVFTGPSRPYLPLKITKILEKGKKRTLSSKDFSRLMEYIADISIEFYKIKDGKYVAIGLDGRIVETADSQLDLLSKIQGKKFHTQVFVWRAGSDVFSGWTT